MVWLKNLITIIDRNFLLRLTWQMKMPYINNRNSSSSNIKFRIPPEAIYEYVVATIEVKEPKLKLYLDKVQIDEIDYKLF